MGRLLDGMEEVLQKGLYSTDTPDRPIYVNFLQQAISAITALCLGKDILKIFSVCD